MIRADATAHGGVLLRQATVRVVAITLVMVAAIAVLILWLQYAAMDKATHKVMASLKHFYTEKLVLWEQEWQEQAIHFHNRLELHNLFDVPGQEWERLRDELNQEGGSPFPILLVVDAHQRPLFQQAASPVILPDVAEADQAGWFEDPSAGILYRWIAQPLWLGARGNGAVILFVPIENGMLFRNALPFTDLFLLHHGRVVASSLGTVAWPGEELGDGTFWHEKGRLDQLSLPWGDLADRAPRLVVRHHSAPIFSVREIFVAGITIFVIFSILFWNTLGLWLVRLTRRITTLGWMAQAFSSEHDLTPAMRNALDEVRRPGYDEVTVVANAMAYAKESVAREFQERTRAEKQAKNYVTYQRVVNSLYEISYARAPLRAQLESALDCILSVPWLAIQGKGAIFLANAPAKTLQLTAHQGLDNALVSLCQHVPYGHCLCGRAALTKTIIHACGVDDRHDIDFDGMLPHGHYVVPILSGEHLLGVLTLYLQSGQARSPDKESLLQAIGNTLGSMIERGRLEESLQNQNITLEEKVAERTAELQDYIASLKNVQVAIREANEQQHAIFEAATIGIALITDRIIRKYNRKFHELLGYHQTELIGQSIQCLYPDEAGYSEVGLADADMSGGEVHQRIQEIRRQDGSHFWCHISSSAIVPGDLSHGTVWTLANVTREHEAMESLQQAKEMAESAARLKSDFLANMSHEIRTPMNAIIGMSHLALKTELTPRQRDYIQKIQGSSQHLMGILNDILDFSKIEAGKLTVDRREFDLEKILDHVASLIVEKSHAKGLELVIDVDPMVPRYLMGDPLRLGQILINYANNAVKFTEQGEISLVVRVYEETGQEVTIHFAVRDTGIGLSEEQKGCLFQSFSQVDTSATRRFGGTGLGLAICKRLAELMGGKVGVDSMLGQGSRFWFTARLGRGAARPLAWLPKADLRGRRVLVVDDHDHARAVLSEMLTSMTFSVEAVASAQAAVEAVQRLAGERPYDLVIFDWRMPEMDGIEMARQIRALGFLDLARTPHLIMVTSGHGEEVFQQAGEAGIEAVLVKPISPSILFDAVMRTLGDKPLALPAVADTLCRMEDLATRQGARILLVEDNALNQEVAMALLAEAGFEADLAANGKLAVQQIQQVQVPYDLVLMDMQMPVMDGVMATREIRRLFLPADLPIVAMTANAMREDREQCEAAGMNDHMAKPIDPDELWQVLMKWLKPRSPPIEPSVRPSTAAATVVTPPCDLPDFQGLDMTMGLRRVLNNPSLYLSMLRKFLDTQKAAPAAIAAALDAGDRGSARRLAHTLKGVAGSIGAQALQDAAARLEAAIKEQPQRTVLDDCLAAVAAVLAPLLTELSTKLPPKDAPPAGAIADIDQMRAICANLATCLAEEDFEANRLFEANAPLLRAAFGDNDYHEIENGISHFDFEKALQVLTRAAKRTKIFKHRKLTG